MVKKGSSGGKPKVGQKPANTRTGSKSGEFGQRGSASGQGKPRTTPPPTGSGGKK